ncbi:hypothetical protein NA78x_004877 [Anatilimnocola sp. NA78]|uniref:hypothetical protein n=1 Tax=Anatilimnocola sp. NA78 TaxID=3415683 RepID=UPI003CE59B50
MPLLIILLVCAILFVVIGITGFSKRGIPLSKTTYVNGISGKLIGTLCILTGVLLLPAFYLFFSVLMALVDPRNQ